MDKPIRYTIDECNPNYLKWLYKATIISIRIMVISFLVAILYFLVFFLMGNSLFFLFFVFPMFTHMLLLYFGGHHINNHYSLKRMGKCIYLDKIQRDGGSTYTIIWGLIFLFGSVIRLYRDIRNLSLLMEYRKLNS
jgi:hypothetical protein